MIKFRQINSTNACVTRDTPDGSPLIQKEYSISDIWVNPRSVLYLQEDSALSTENTRAPLVGGLSQSHSFTKLFISENGFARTLSVVGQAATIADMIGDEDEQK